MLTKIKHSSILFIWKIIDCISSGYANKAVLPGGVVTVPDVPYKTQANEKQILDIHRPVKEGGSLPVIAFIHGGGFVAGDKKHMRQYCVTLAKEGYLVFNINYRLAPRDKHPAQLEDIMAAVAWIADNCAAYGGNKEELFIGGDSAGAYLAAAVACIISNSEMAARLRMEPPFTTNRIKGVFLLSGLFDLHTASSRRFVGLKGSLEIFLGICDFDSSENLDRYSVTANINGAFPPTFVACGEIDGLYPESVAFISALKNNHIPHQTLFFDKSEKKAFHGYYQQLHLQTAKECLKRLLRFLACRPAK